MAGSGVLDNTMMELALEGERLCKSGDFRSGIAFFEAAIQAGCDDLKTLSAIYSQLGNAYFYMGDYVKAMNFHKHDLTLARTSGDKLGEAKASGNLGNTLKVMGKFDEAIICCGRHLEITTKLQDKIGQTRAYYNLANAYHSKGKHMGKNGQQDPGEFPEEIRLCLLKAVELYQSNLDLTQELNDRNGEGRACGNLGNVHYLLGNFDEAIVYHNKRLEIAQDFGDKNAERRAYTNLGNAYVFSGKFETAAKDYLKSLVLSKELGDQAVEAQACYSLGNTYTLLKDYNKAIEYHLKHLQIAQQVQDKVGEGRAFWSLGNAYSSIGDHRQALLYAREHLAVATDVNDVMGQKTAEQNIGDLYKVLGIVVGDEEEEEENTEFTCTGTSRRKSMEEMSLIRMTPEARSVGKTKRHGGLGEENMGSDSVPTATRQLRSLSLGHVLFTKGGSSKLSTKNVLNVSKTSDAEDEEEDQDNFFDLLTKCQGGRMDDQRCSMPQYESDRFVRPNVLGGSSDSFPSPSSSKVRPPFASTGSFNQQHHNNLRMLGCSSKDGSKSKAPPIRANSLPIRPQRLSIPEDQQEISGSDDLLDLIFGMQSQRMDEQRASLPDSCLEGDDDKFFDMLIRCQGSRLEEQRSVLPEEGGALCHPSPSTSRKCRGPTVPDEDFFSLIARLQEGRMDDQRADIKDKNRNRIN